MAIDSKHAFIAMEEVVSNNGVKLVVNGIVCRKAVVNAAIGNIHIGERLQGKGVVLNER